jgi:CMP-N-acetylneuraminic acid synthetase
LQHAANYLAEKEGYLADIIVCLQPTSPLCSAEDIDKAITLCISTGADSVVSLCQVEHHPYWMKKVVSGRIYSLMEEDDEKYQRRQDLPPVYQLNGAIRVIKRRVLLEEERIAGEHALAYIMPQERSIDIDTPIDFKIAELILSGETTL